MSRTKRKIRRQKNRGSLRGAKEIIEGDDSKAKHFKGWWGNRKMRPYTSKPNDQKFEAESYTGTAPTKNDKLITKNANRSRKKAYRQKLKKELKDELRQYTGHT